tara:strand:- start:27 stop:263 length:237 start_codon:yes stop_codon:yes gene_type:complete
MNDQEMLKALEQEVELPNKELSVLVFKLVQFSVQQMEANKAGHQVNLDIQTCLHAADKRLDALEQWTHDIMPSNGRAQ